VMIFFCQDTQYCIRRRRVEFSRVDVQMFKSRNVVIVSA